MGRGWRRAFCTSVERDDRDILQGGGGGGGDSEQLKSRRLKLVGGGKGFFSSASSTSSNPSTPRLQTPPPQSPRQPPPPPPPPLQCKTTTTTTTPRPETPSSNKQQHIKESPRLFQFSSSSPSGTRSPSRFALFKTALRLSRNRCGICAGSVTSSGDQRRTAVFTAECSHVFHFPCISTHVRTCSSLVCPVCSASWHEVPLLSSSLLHSNSSSSSPHPPTLDNNNNHHHDVKNKNSHRQGQGGASAVCKVYDDDESLQPSPTSRSTAAAAAAGGGGSSSSSGNGGGGGGCGVQLQFNPIPEEGEEEEEEEEEDEEEEDINAIDDEKQGGGGGGGGGHLHNRQQPRQGRDANTIHVMPEATALLSTERSHQIYVVAIKVKAPSIPPKLATTTTTGSSRTRQAAAAAAMSFPPSLLDPSQRAPIDLVTVLDASGSMTAPKLQMLKRAMRLLISSLGPADRLSIVAFSNVAAKRLLPLRRMSRQGQRSARQIVDRLVLCGSNQNNNNNNSCSSSSCAGDALRKATKVLEDRRERNPVATIMLLSDVHGQQQQQQQQQNNRRQHNSSSSSSSQCSATRFAHLEIPIHDSTSPAQQQHVKQRILAQVDDGDDAALAKCVNGLVSVVLQDVNLQFAFPSGIISSVYSYTTQGRGSGAGIGRGTIAHGEGGKSVRLGDMYAGEERELLVEIRVPKTVIVGSHHHAAASLSMSVLCSYRDPVTRELIQCGEIPLAIVLGMTLPYPSQSHHPTTLLRSSSSSSTAAITTTATATINGSQEEQLLLRNLFVITRAMAESRRLVDLNQLDMAVNLISSARTLILKQSNSSNISTNKKFLGCLETELAQLLQQQQQQRRRQQRPFSPSQRRSEQALLLAETSRSGGGGGGEQPLTPTSAWRAAEQLAKVAIMRKSLNRVSDLHGLENARF